MKRFLGPLFLLVFSVPVFADLADDVSQAYAKQGSNTSTITNYLDGQLASAQGWYGYLQCGYSYYYPIMTQPDRDAMYGKLVLMSSCLYDTSSGAPYHRTQAFVWSAYASTSLNNYWNTSGEAKIKYGNDFIGYVGWMTNSTQSMSANITAGNGYGASAAAVMSKYD